MKKYLSGSIGFVFLMSMVGCAYNPGTYDPCSGCSVGSGWSIGCSDGCPPAPCKTYQTPGCQAPVHQPVYSSGYSNDCSTGCQQSYCGENCGGGCYGGHAGYNRWHGCPLNPLNWVRYIFHSGHSCGHVSTGDFYCSPACASGRSAYGGSCQPGSYENCGAGGCQAPQQLTPVPAPQSVTSSQPVTYQHQFSYYQSAPTGVNSYVILPTGATFSRTPRWAVTNR